MYNRDVPAIRAKALASPDGLAGAVTFAILSIRQPFGSLENAVNDVRRRGADSRFLWGWKRGGYEYVQEHKAELWASLRDVTDATDAIVILTTIPGLGIVKAAFVAQMLGHDVACFDSRNAETLELPSRAFELHKSAVSRPATRRRKIDAYVTVTRDTGGARHWWDTWCNGIAPSLGLTGSAVSALHVKLTGALARGALAA